MSNFSKIVILIIVILSFFFVKEKIGFDIKFIDNLISSLKLPKIEQQKPIEEVIQKPSEIINKEEKQTETINIYFLALDSNDNGVYKKVKRNVPNNEDKISYAIKELLKGPNIVEKAAGAYSEIPASTKLLGINNTGNKIIINFSSDFQYGGGTDSIYSRMMQLIKTAIENSNNKKVYLYLDGKQIKFIGGEGIMITQPLSEKSLEI